ncbi:UTP--glucose-1-phosphate uridylyltransferase GalU [Bacillus massilinigeriensis]|uniref:UTP--glucose-1-phosphate uridylyltransferase GalU n=1 Tax=Bacillus mediterraneensis TaxID=1805474 RepID=UPI0008F829F7|nr:UTP--glucose-1-phosphate uridylyltransferase GalU [Bacillus mediterraneensis]
MKIRKAIIPAAGLGTRFLPATKAQPKEMLPIVDKPTIQYIVEEAVASGIEDILIISGRGKRAIEDHFDKSYELEETLAQKEKWDILEQVQGISRLANIHYVRQKEPLGLGHAIYCARTFVENEPFAVLLGDDIIQTEGTPGLKQLMDVYQKKEASVVGVQPVDWNDVSKYGVIDCYGEEGNDRVFKVNALVEKPAREEAPSNYAILGRYVLKPEIFSILENLAPGAGGEIQLTDALQILNKSDGIYACHFEGNRYDVGDKFGFIKATLDFALQREDIKDNVRSYLDAIVHGK